MEHDQPIAIRQLRSGGRVIRVQFFRNRGGSVAGRLLLGQHDTPILDGPSPDAILDQVRDLWDALRMVREPA